LALTPLDIISAILIVAVGSLIQGTVGFGVALVAIPFLVLIDPALAPGPVLFAACFLGLIQFRRERSEVDTKELSYALAGRVIGTAPALVVLKMVSANHMSLLFGLLVLAAVALSAVGPRIRPNPTSLLAGGTLSGFMGTISSIGGPAMVLVYQHEPGPRLRSTLGLFFAAGSVISMVSLAAVGLFGLREVVYGTLLLPGVFAGFALSRRFAKHLDRGGVRPAVLIGAAAAAVVVIAQSVMHG
jgi:hypothetical protein